MKKILSYLRCHINLFILIIACLSLALIICVDAMSFSRYKASMIAQEQQQLLMLARTAGNHLENAMEHEISELELYFAGLEGEGIDIEGLKRAVRLYGEKKDGIVNGLAVYDYEASERIYSTIRDGEVSGAIEESLKTPAYEKQARIIGKVPAESGWYELLLRYRMPSPGCDIFVSLNLNYFHENIVARVQIGKEGYSVVKDKDLAIIMHHAKSQIGMDALYDRAERYPQLDLRSLTEWIERQKREEFGVGILDSYVWDSDELEPVQRIVAFTTIHFQGESWIVNSTLPINELSKPLGAMISIIMLFTVIYLIVLLAVVTTFLRSHYQEEAQGREIEYLRELNQGMELIYKQREEIRHYQRVQSLGMMASHIAHEFNNFLTPVLVYSELLENDDSLSEENRELMSEVSLSVNRASRLSRDLLAFARQDSGSRLRLLDLRVEAENAIAVVEKLCPAGVDMTVSLADEKLTVQGREGMLQHILLNLSKNAFQAMEKSKRKELYLTLVRERKYAVLTVGDSGCGISEEAKKRIFEPFYTTKGSKQGTGLGLSVIQNIMSSLSGYIELDSAAGQGSEFRLYFPLVEENENKMLRIRKIALVSMREDIDDIVRKWSRLYPKYSFSIYKHPAKLISTVKEDKSAVDMVLSEYRIEGMDGAELLSLVRRLNDRIRLILCMEESAKDMEWYVNNGIIDRILLRRELEEFFESSEAGSG